MEEKEIKYALVKQHQTIQQLQLFRVMKRGAREKEIERYYKSNDKKTSVTIKMLNELDISDQDLFFVILAMSLVEDRGDIISQESENINIKLWNKLQVDGDFKKWDTIKIETTFYELNKELGKKNGSSGIKWAKESLDRLSLTNIKIDSDKYNGASNLLNYTIDKSQKIVKIAINPLSASVLIEDKKGYVFHNRIERLSLSKAPAKALYSILAGLVTIKRIRSSIRVSVLIEKMYFINWNETISEQRKSFKRSFKKALEEIGKLELWQIIDNQNDTIKIIRT